MACTTETDGRRCDASVARASGAGATYCRGRGQVSRRRRPGRRSRDRGAPRPGELERGARLAPQTRRLPSAGAHAADGSALALVGRRGVGDGDRAACIADGTPARREGHGTRQPGRRPTAHSSIIEPLVGGRTATDNGLTSSPMRSWTTAGRRSRSPVSRRQPSGRGLRRCPRPR